MPYLKIYIKTLIGLVILRDRENCILDIQFRVNQISMKRARKLSNRLELGHVEDLFDNEINLSDLTKIGIDILDETYRYI